jgi:hypothetical protein
VDRDAAVEVLCSFDLAHIVDLVAWPADDGAVMVANSAGAARLAPGEPDEVMRGRNPVANQDPLALSSYDEEAADPSPPNARHAYPYAGERLRSFFADRRAPDVVVVHTGRHYFPEYGGHLGEHGSLNVTQSRAPLLVSGPGIEARGIVDDHARTVDVAPTLAVAAGVAAERLPDLDGRARSDLVAGSAPYVVGLLWDGTSCTDLLHLAQSGELPNVARLLERGCALRGGAIAEFPSSTLCNHTSALTGVGPGRHGVIGNVYYDRDTGQRVVPNDESTWHRSAEWLRPGVVTVFEQVAAARPGAHTASVNEPIDRGAGYSTMALIRANGAAGARGLSASLPDPRTSPLASQAYVAADPTYALWTQIDDAGLQQMLDLFASAAAAPGLAWWNSTLTDAGHHAGGPRSPIARAAMCDSDRRLGVFLHHLETLGILEETVILLTADHGFEGADPQCRGDWGVALASAGVAVTDEGPGFLYLGGG